MALFGGGFATGLVTGLAESANKALKDDIERINTRVDKIAEFKVKRAIEEQEDRAKEIGEVEEALQEGYALFGGDDNQYAAEYSAGLLKQAGSVAAFKARIAELRKAKDDNGTDLGAFMERASKDAPTASLTDYANAFVGAPKTFAGDYRMPEDLKPAGGLVSKIVGKPIDTMALAGAQAKEEIAARIGTVKFESVPLPTVTFQAERFKLSQMSASERITYINDKLANPDNTEERVTELQGMLTTALDTAAKTGSITTKIDAKKQLLERAETPEEKDKLIDEISELTFERETTEAEAEGNAIGVIDAKIKREQYLGNTDNVKSLLRKKKELSGTEESFSEITAQLETDLMRGLANGTVIEGSDAHKAAMSEIEKRRDIEQNVTGSGDMKPSEIRGAQSYYERELRSETQKRLGALGSAYSTVMDMVEKGTDVIALTPAEQTTYRRGQEVEAEVRAEIVTRMTSTYSEEDWPELYAHLRMKRLLPSNRQTTGDVIETGSGDNTVTSETDTATVPSVGDQTEEAIPTDTKPTQPTTTDVVGEVTEDEKLQYPKTVEGALSITQGISSVGGTPQDAYQAAMDLHGDEQFATTVEFIASKDDTGLDGLEKDIAEMALQGLDANQITQQLKQVKYARDPSMDVASISSTVARVLAELSPEARKQRIESKKRADEARETRLRIANQPPPSLQLPTGLMSRQ
jgi:hypothetical protein